MRTEERYRYFSWLLTIIDEDTTIDYMDYIELLKYLYSKEFTWTMRMDENRAADGVDLRIRYIDNNELIDSDYIYDCIDGPCTILEMLIALADRGETHIMSNPAYGNRTGEWFWLMIDNLNLASAYVAPRIFDERVADHIIDIFLNREYSATGEGGGLFVIENPRRDLRDIEIWYQMNWYFNEVLE